MFIGGTLGILEVEGNSSQNGDIVLSLQENDMVRIVPETKKLILIGKLDKEVSSVKYSVYLFNKSVNCRIRNIPRISPVHSFVDHGAVRERDVANFSKS